MSAADEQAREVEVRLVGEAIEDAAMRLKGRDLGTVHRDQIAREALDALEPIRAAERQEAAREALDRVGAEIDRLHFSGAPAEAMHLQVVHNAAIDLAVRSIEVAARQHDDRADGVTGRSET